MPYVGTPTFWSATLLVKTVNFLECCLGIHNVTYLFRWKWRVQSQCQHQNNATMLEAVLLINYQDFKQNVAINFWNGHSSSKLVTWIVCFQKFRNLFFAPCLASRSIPSTVIWRHGHGIFVKGKKRWKLWYWSVVTFRRFLRELCKKNRGGPSDLYRREGYLTLIAIHFWNVPSTVPNFIHCQRISLADYGFI